MSRRKFQREDQEEPGNVSKTVTLFLFDFEFLTYEYISWPDMYTQRTFDEDRHESQMFSLSLVYWFFYYLRSDFQQTTNKARYDAICVQECPNFNIWGYGLRSKRFEGSRLYSKIILVLQATKRWGSGLHGKKFRAPGLRPPPPFGTLLYSHECFTGKYTTRKIHKNYIRDPNGVFSIISLVSFLDDVISLISLYYFIDVFLSI